MRLNHLSDQELLRLRICDLPGLKDGVLDRRVAPFVSELHAELSTAGLKHFRPGVYLGDEWFSPEGVPKIAVPFYLGHPRLAKLERSMMDEVEGGTPKALRQLLRHEAGHSFDHAYNISKGAETRRAWRQIFGTSPRRYNPDVYIPNLSSRDFVHHLPGGYAQAHPDEDFAETFAVVVTPGSDWARRYRKWPVALRKLEFTRALIRTYGRRRPAVVDGPECYVASRMRRTVGSYYMQRRHARETQCGAVKKLTERAGLSNTAWTH